MKFKSLWKEIIASHNSKIEGQQLRSWDKRQGRVVQSWVKITWGQCKIWIQTWKPKKHFSFNILFVYKLMIGSSKNNIDNYLRKSFWTEDKETQVKR